MPAHPSLSATRLGVGTVEDYEAAGWSRSMRRHAIRHGRLVRVAAGRFAPAVPHLDSYQQADLALARRSIAATVPRDRVAVSHLGSAYLRGCPIWAPSPRACATTWDERVRQIAGVHLHHLAGTGSLVRVLGVPTTSMARALVDIACEFGTESALVSGDFAVRHGMLELPTLSDVLEECRGLTGIAHARLLPTLLDPLAESPLESRGRWHIHEHRLPMPHSQVLLHTLEGRLLGRADHYWAEGVVGEADGMQKYRGRDDPLGLEKVRGHGLEDVDLEVVRWIARDLRDFTAAAARVERARRRRWQRIAAGETPRWIATTLAGVRIPVVMPA